MTRVLVAGIGNVFLGDDAFGVEVATRMRERTLAENVRVWDFGIRGIDLAYALQDDCDAAIIVATMSLGEPAGTLYVIEVDETSTDGQATPLTTAHGFDPFDAVRLARSSGAGARTFVVGCEPESFATADVHAGRMGLSDPVAEAVDRAADLIEELAAELAVSRGDGERRARPPATRRVARVAGGACRKRG